MKKLLSVVLALTLVTTCFFAFVANADEEGVTVVGITFESEVANLVKEVPQAGGSTANLIDGITLEDHVFEGSTPWAVNGVMLLQNTVCTDETQNPIYSYTLELSDRADVNAIKVYFYEHYNAMIGLPKDNKIAVEYSEDGENFTFAGDYTFEGTAEPSEIAVNAYEIDLGKTITGKYIKLTFQFGPSPFDTDGKVVWEWQGLTELGVVGTPATIVDLSEDESSAAPVSSEAPVQTSEDTSSTTPTGDSGFVSLAVIAVIALAGAAVAIKRK